MIFADDGAKLSPNLHARIRDILQGYLGRVGQFVREGQQSGCIRSELPPETVAMMFFGIIMPAGLLWHLTDGGFDVTRHAERAWRVFSEAIAVAPT
jgi:hypothetical protein